MDNLYFYDVGCYVDDVKFTHGNTFISSLISSSDYRRKCVFSIMERTSINSTSTRKLFSQRGRFIATSTHKEIFSIAILGKVLQVSNLIIGDDYEYEFAIFIDYPKLSDDRCEHIPISMLQESEILNITFNYCNAENKCKIEPMKMFRTYESYGSYGFFLVDIKKIEKFFDNYGREIGNNLIEEFTTTEIAGDIFDNGLAVLCWGGTPWLYYIESGEEENKCAIGDKTEYVGIYNLDETISELSVIPGDALSDWDACKVKEWPRISVVGGGNKVKVELFIKKEYSTKERIDTGITSPIPTFFISRCDNDDRSEPLLSYSIF